MAWWNRLRDGLALKPASRHELVGIQYVRAAAALMVVVDHAGGMTGEPKYFGHEAFGGMLSAGGVGVDLFFCLSGFIIVYISLNGDGSPTMGLWTFIKRRFARIIPFMWLVIVAYAALRKGARGSFPASSYVRAFTLFPVGHVEPNIIWTLRHEWLFYLVFAATFLSGRKWLLALWVLSPLVLALIGLGGMTDTPGWQGYAEFLFSYVDLLFGLGVILGLVFVRWRSSWPSGRWAEPLLVVLLAAVYALSMALGYTRTVLWQIQVVGMLSCAVIAVACSVRAPRRWVGDIGRRLGDASYCIYLTHTAMISAVLGVLVHRAPHASDATIMILAVSIAVSGGLILHYFVERPVVAWAQRIVFPRRIEGR